MLLLYLRTFVSQQVGIMNVGFLQMSAASMKKILNMDFLFAFSQGAVSGSRIEL